MFSQHSLLQPFFFSAVVSRQCFSGCFCVSSRHSLSPCLFHCYLQTIMVSLFVSLLTPDTHRLPFCFTVISRQSLSPCLFHCYLQPLTVSDCFTVISNRSLSLIVSSLSPDTHCSLFASLLSPDTHCLPVCSTVISRHSLSPCLFRCYLQTLVVSDLRTLVLMTVSL